MNNKKIAINQRISRILQEWGELAGVKSLRRKAFLMRIPYTTLRNYLPETARETGPAEPPASVLQAVANLTGCSCDWLLCGRGPIFPAEETRGSAPQTIGEQHGVPLFIDNETLVNAPEREHYVPIVSNASAGLLVEANDRGYPPGTAEEYIYYPRCIDRNAYALRVEGDSMEPGYIQGDVIIVSPHTYFQNNMPAVLLLQNGLHTFKLIRVESDSYVATPINRHYEKVICPQSEVRAVHPVIDRIRKRRG